ncbi:MAG: hypothetical protein ACYS5V_16460, partial [Planctomycetota bacterium]
MNTDACQRLMLTGGHFAWQASGVAAAAAGAGRALRRSCPTRRYALCLAALLTMLLCPPVTFPLVDVSPSAQPAIVTNAAQPSRPDAAPAAEPDLWRRRLDFAMLPAATPATAPANTPATAPAAHYERAFVDLYLALGRQYPCFKLKGIDWRAVGAELLPRARDVKTDEQFGLLCMELVARLEDSHAFLRAGTAKPPV